MNKMTTQKMFRRLVENTQAKELRRLAKTLGYHSKSNMLRAYYDETKNFHRRHMVAIAGEYERRQRLHTSPMRSQRQPIQPTQPAQTAEAEPTTEASKRLKIIQAAAELTDLALDNNLHITITITN